MTLVYEMSLELLLLVRKTCMVLKSLEFRHVKDFWQGFFAFWLGVSGHGGLP